jgi:predicted nucleotidyltransferase
MGLLRRLRWNAGMTKSETITRLKQQADAVRALGATSLYLFGSMARNEAGPSSDLDLFIDHDSGNAFSLVDLARIKLLLEDEFGGDVDITTRDSLHPRLRDRIEQSAIRIFCWRGMSDRFSRTCST